MSTLAKTKKQVTIKVQVLYGLIAAASAVVLPQLLHTAGNVLGLGSALGETFLPMHLPVLLVGFLIGPYAGALAGLIAPLASFALSGMPSEILLPFMVIELCAYGLFAGLMREKNIPSFFKVLSVQVIGRAIRAAAILLAVYAFGYSMNVSIIWTSIMAGLGGIALQLALIPLVMAKAKKK